VLLGRAIIISPGQKIVAANIDAPPPESLPDYLNIPKGPTLLNIFALFSILTSKQQLKCLFFKEA